MKRLIKAMTTALVIVMSSASMAQGLMFKITHPDAVGGGFVASHFDRSHVLASGESTSAGPGAEVFVVYNLKTPGMFITAGTGFYRLTDELFSMDQNSRNLFPTAELKLGYNLLHQQKFSPFVFAGLQAYYHSTETPLGKYSGGDGGFLLGGGFKFDVNDKMSAFVSGDYRYVFTDTDDPKAQYWIAKAGISYALNPVRKNRESIEYPMDDSDLALEALFRETENEGADTRETPRSTEEDALALLFQEEEQSGATTQSSTDPLDELFATSTDNQPVEAASNYDTSTETGRLMAKIDELRQAMDMKDRELSDLRSKVSANEKAIVEVSRGMAGQIAGMSGETLDDMDMNNFKSTYQHALQRHYSKDYKGAIDVFTALLQSRPDHRLASNCQYWIGESYNAMGRHADAIAAFNKVLNYSNSYKFDDALLMTGIVYLKLGNESSARENFQKLVSMFPDSEYAPKAMRYLGRL